MALVSPGVQVTVTDQSYYAPTQQGSVAYILVATAQDKVAPGGASIAPGTLAENAGTVYNITSQRDLVTTFGTPTFQTTAAGTPVNGGEQNEYGLMAAYSLLGVSNTVYVQRADVDLGGLTGSTTRPLADPATGALWLDTTNTNWGVYEWNGTTQTFVLKTTSIVNSATNLAADDWTPNVSVGSIGQYAVNTTANTNPIFYKTYDNSWQLVGNIGWQERVATVTGTNTSVNTTTTSNLTINGTNISISSGSNVSVVSTAINDEAITGITSNVSASNQLMIFVTQEATSGQLAISGANVLADLGITAGTYNGPASTVAPYYSIPSYEFANTAVRATGVGRPTGSVWQKASVIGSGLDVAIKQYNASTDIWSDISGNDYDTIFTATYGLDPTGGGLNITPGEVFAEYSAFADVPAGQTPLATRMWYRKNSGSTVMVGSTTTPTSTSGDELTITTRANAASVTTTVYTVSITSTTADGSGFVDAVSAADIPYVSAAIDSTGAMTLIHELGGDVQLDQTSGTPLDDVGLNDTATNIYSSIDQTGGVGNHFIGTNWEPMSDRNFTVSSTQPFISPANDTLWYYNTPSRVDIMVSNGSAWLGYRNESADIRGYNLSQTNSTGPIISASAPLLQDDNTALVYGDLWLDTSDLENYPALYRWQSVSGVDQWVLIDSTDSTGQNGIVFADARWATSGSTNVVTDAIPPIGGDTGLNKSNWVDLDAPDPAFYPRGILLFNTRASGYNVKQYKTQYFTSQAYPGESIPTEGNTWVSISGVNSTGVVPNFGRKAQRGVVVNALKSAIDSSTALREDSNIFNLIACPGYPELIPNMVTLNEDRDNTAFIVGDTPMRLPATGTAIQAWANNTANAGATGEDGLATSNPYAGIYYPSGLTNDLSGNSIAVPPSHASLRAIVKSDNVSYPWLAPAGTRRGLIDNLGAIGYVDANTGQFISIGVSQGLRDVMYNNKINPLTNLPGTGLVVYGQKTIAPEPSSLDRINVARLVNFLRSQLNIIARPFVFEPNDPITRNALLAVVNSLLNDLVAKRGITDYVSVCDTTNNTPERIARNELYVDVAIQPTKSVEFIYIPIRLKNPGEIQDGNLASATNPGTGA